MAPWSMDHPCGPSLWTSSWTRSVHNPRRPPLSFEGEFLPEVQTNFRSLKIEEVVLMLSGSGDLLSIFVHVIL